MLISLQAPTLDASSLLGRVLIEPLHGEVSTAPILIPKTEQIKIKSYLATNLTLLHSPPNEQEAEKLTFAAGAATAWNALVGHADAAKYLCDALKEVDRAAEQTRVVTAVVQRAGRVVGVEVLPLMEMVAKGETPRWLVQADSDSDKFNSACALSIYDRNPKAVRAAKIGATVLAVGAAAPFAAAGVLGAVGFSAAGVVGGSVAAAAQAAAGNVVAGSVFAGCQSIAAAGLGTTASAAAGAFGGGVATFFTGSEKDIVEIVVVK